MAHPDSNMLIPYAFRSIPEHTTEVVWNDREGPAPSTIRLRSGQPAIRLGRVAAATSDYVAPEGSRKFIEMTEEFAEEEAERLADFYWGREDTDANHQIPVRLGDLHETRDDLAAVLLQGLLEEVRRGAVRLVDVYETVENQPDQKMIPEEGAP